MAKKSNKPRKKYHEKTLSRDDHTLLMILVDNRVELLDQDLKTLRDKAYPDMEPENVDDVEHQLRRIRAGVARLGELLGESNRVVLRSEKKL